MKRILLFGCLLGLAVSCGNPDTPKESDAGLSEAFMKNIQTVAASLGDETAELILTGKVEYDPERIVSYVPIVSGAVVKSHFTLGDRIARGHRMLDIRSAELNGLHAEQAGLKTAVQAAERELQMVRSMVEDKMATESELLQAQSAVADARSSLERVQEDLALYGTKNTDGTWTVTAPAGGFVVAKNTSSGSPFAAESEPLFTIADLSTVWVMANVYAGDLEFVREGQPVVITALSYPGEQFEGRISAISHIFDPEEKVVKARIVMPNPDLKLKPDMSVNVQLKSGAESQTASASITVPADALIFDDDRYFVVVYDGAEAFDIREVTLKGQYHKKAYLTSGLSAGEQVVTENQLLIFSGLKQ